jgi:hypothetical protein
MRFCSHQTISASRAKPLSARSRIFTRRQRPRIWWTIRAISSTAPAEASMSGQGRAAAAAGLELAGEDRHRRVVAQLVVVDQILIAERDAEHPLADQRRLSLRPQHRLVASRHVADIGDTRSRLIHARIAANSARGTATSASWKTT